MRNRTHGRRAKRSLETVAAAGDQRLRTQIYPMCSKRVSCPNPSQGRWALQALGKRVRNRFNLTLPEPFPYSAVRCRRVSHTPHTP